MPHSPLSDKVRVLIQKSRIVSFASWHSVYPDTAIAKFQVADDAGRYLSQQELSDLQILIPAVGEYIPIVNLLSDQASQIVDESRRRVVAAFPRIILEGGELYPAERANACWRDFWHFLRCITYGIAGQRLDYLSADGLGYMQELYQELQVPIGAMILGLESIKVSSLKRVQALRQNTDQQDDLAPYFDRLIEEFKLFKPI